MSIAPARERLADVFLVVAMFVEFFVLMWLFTSETAVERVVAGSAFLAILGCVHLVVRKRRRGNPK